jgi:hypothetical protein
VGTACGGTITNTYTATDASGNMAVCTQVITIDDTEPPIITCPADKDLFLGNQCQADTSTSNAGQAIATDNCNEVTISHADQVTLQIKRAIAPRYPTVTDCDMDLTNFPKGDGEHHWRTMTDAVTEKIRILLEPGIEKDTIEHISVFALAPIPILVHLGRQLS